MPCQFDPYSTHIIVVDDNIILLSLQGVISAFSAHESIPQELNTLPQLVMTSTADWNPSLPSLTQCKEEASRKIGAFHFYDNVQDNVPDHCLFSQTVASANTYCTSTLDMSLVQDDDDYRLDDLYHHMLAQVQVSAADL